MDCPQCRKILGDGARFCDDCGYRVSLPDAANELKETEVALASHEVDPLVGRTLDGKYELTARLGEGGMGTVYRARRTHIGDEVAVKVLHSIYTRDASILERFRREARAAAQLQHPNVVAIYDLSEARDRESPSYIVMELVKGESLRDRLRREGKIETRRAVSIMRSICAGVGAAHRSGITHRDLKPDNIMALPPDEDDERERVKVLDFGIAKLRDMAGAATLTQTGTIMGTPYYMSPEQCRGESLDARADVYSLGTILYEMLSGRPPFMAQTPTGIITKHLLEPPPPLPEELKVAPEIKAVIRRALAKEADERQADATGFSRELLAAMNAPAAVTAPTASAPLLPPTIPAIVSAPDTAPPTVPSQPKQSLIEEQTAASDAATITPPDSRPLGKVSLTSLGMATNEGETKRRASALWLGIGGVASIIVLAFIIDAAMQWRGDDATNTREATNSTNATARNDAIVVNAAPSPRTSTGSGAAMANRHGMEFALVPAGSFMMGSTDNRNERADSPSERPVHRVNIARPFYMGRHEVTQAQWQAVMGNNSSHFRGDNLPVETLSWDDAQEFIRRLNTLNDGYTYRLPSEAEWEYACRAGTTGDYAGNLDAMAWYRDNSGGSTHPVGQKQPNGFGLYDMHGNVEEWCADWFHYNYNGAPSDGSARLSRGTLPYRMFRGGSFPYHASRLRSAARDWYEPGVRYNFIGFRVVAVSRAS